MLNLWFGASTLDQALLQRRKSLPNRKTHNSKFQDEELRRQLRHTQTSPAFAGWARLLWWPSAADRIDSVFSRTHPFEGTQVIDVTFRKSRELNVYGNHECPLCRGVVQFFSRVFVAAEVMILTRGHDDKQNEEADVLHAQVTYPGTGAGTTAFVCQQLTLIKECICDT